MMALDDEIRPFVEAIKKDAADGKHGAKQLIDLYQLHVSCPSDPGAPGLCRAAFENWRRLHRIERLKETQAGGSDDGGNIRSSFG